MPRIKTADIASKLGIDYEVLCEEGSEPELSDLSFSDILPELRDGGPRSKSIATKKLYKHQELVFKYLSKGHNIILKSGTGSGKTEAWVIYALSKGIKVLAIYPTLALSADQVNRIYDYYSSLGLQDKVFKVDRPSLEGLNAFQVRSKVSNSLVVITNPAFLMADLKRYAEYPPKSYLKDFLRELDMIVVDELDFYGSKGASLIIAMIEIISEYISRKRPQVVILTATLGNPEELSKILSDVTKRETVVIEGKPFKVRNCTYLVLGKNLENVRKYILSELIDYLDKDLIEIVEDPIKFRRSSIFIVDYLRRKGLRVPDIYFNPREIIKEYVNDELVTLVFTPSIRVTERIVREVRESLPPNLKNSIVPHHHLVPKKEREIIEEKARANPPKVKVIVTVRTLLQGIDIGNVVRVVHYGIPPEVREFMQREGRKGRRKELKETESIILPTSLWDRSLASLGIDGIKEYLKLPLEKVIISRSNEYSTLFKALFKVIANIELSPTELNLLEKLKLISVSNDLFSKRIVLNRAGLDVWNKLNFYEYGLPYGIRRILVRDSRGINIEPISRRDFVERYQVGAIDIGNEALVTEVRKGSIIEYSLSSIDHARRKYGYLDEALNMYEEIKIRWRERPNFKRDVLKGKVTSVVDVSVSIPAKGFGLFKEVPMRARWIIESNKHFKLRRLGDSIVPYFEEDVVELNVVPSGIYQDFTYGYVYELPLSKDLWKLRIGAATLSLILRVLPKYAISFRELSIVVDPLPIPPVRVLIWEPEASGITKLIDWYEVLNDLNNIKPRNVKLWIHLLKLIDREAALEIISRGINWEDAIEYAKELLRCVVGAASVKIFNRELFLPKPCKDLRILSLEIISINLDSETIYALGEYDGDDYKGCIIKAKGFPEDTIKKVEDIIRYVVDNDLTLVTSSHEAISKLIFSKSIEWIYEKALVSGKVINPFELITNCLGGEVIDVRRLREYLNIDLPNAVEVYEKVRKGYRGWDHLLKKYVSNLAKLTYYAYLIHRYLIKNNLCRYI